MQTETDNAALISLARYLRMPGAGWQARDIVETAINRMKADSEFISAIEAAQASHKILRTRKT